MADEDALEALNDPRQVMMEVLGLVEDLRLASNRLGDAIVAGGLSAREWRSPDARLATLSDQFPDITVDDLITRLAEFAGLGQTGCMADARKSFASMRRRRFSMAWCARCGWRRNGCGCCRRANGTSGRWSARWVMCAWARRSIRWWRRYETWNRWLPTLCR